MTEPIRYGQTTRLPGNRVAVTGTLGEVAAKLAYIDSRVGLLSASDPVPTGVPGQFIVTVRTMPRQVAAQAPGRTAAPVRRRMPRRAVGVAVVGGVAVAGGLLAGVVWLINAAVGAVVDNSASIAGVLLLLAVVLAVLRRATGGGGRTFSGTFKGRMD